MGSDLEPNGPVLWFQGSGCYSPTKRLKEERLQPVQRALPNVALTGQCMGERAGSLGFWGSPWLCN